MAFAHNLLEHPDALFFIFPFNVHAFIRVTQVIQLVHEKTEIHSSEWRSFEELSRNLPKFLVQWFGLCFAQVLWSNPPSRLESTMNAFLAQIHDMLENVLGARFRKQL